MSVVKPACRRVSVNKSIVLVFLTVAVLSLTVTGGCVGKSVGDEAGDSVSSDSVPVVETDSVEPADSMEALISSQPMPKAAEELFDDFIFNFAANRRLQMERVDFPVAVRDGALTLTIEEDEWSMERFFMQQGYYTLILDSRQQLALTKDTSVCHVVVEKFDLRSSTAKNYLFDRVGGEWRMTSMEHVTLADNVNAAFITFYETFATDSTVRVGSIADPVKVTAPDPDDDFRYTTIEVPAAEWATIGLDDLPCGTLYNVVYGSQQYTRADKKVLILRGIANGMEIELTFRRQGGRWRLTEIME